jgi:hypothetical protein
MSDAFLTQHLAKVENQINEAMTAMSELLVDSISQYTLNTGSTVTTVTKANIQTLDNFINSQLALRDTLRQRLGLDTGGSFQAVPGW